MNECPECEQPPMFTPVQLALLRKMVFRQLFIDRSWHFGQDESALWRRITELTKTDPFSHAG